MSLALVAAGLLLAAGCGGGDGGGDDVASVSGDEEESAQGDESSEEQQEQELLDWVECMNEEGVEIPDPVRDEDGNLVIEGNGIHIGGGEGGVTAEAEPPADADAEDEPPINREDMEAATEVCGMAPLVGAGNLSEEEQQERQDDALAFAECMRAEGIEDFPDPDFSDEGPGGEAQEHEATPSDEGEGPNQQIIVGPFGEIDMDDPEVAAAFEACQDELGMPGGGPGGEGGGAEPAEDSEG